MLLLLWLPLLSKMAGAAQTNSDISMSTAELLSEHEDEELDRTIIHLDQDMMATHIVSDTALTPGNKRPPDISTYELALDNQLDEARRPFIPAQRTMNDTV